MKRGETALMPETRRETKKETPSIFKMGKERGEREA